jgi:hypothetical protein
MALYPPPSSNVPTFNVDLFSNTIGYGANNYATSLAFPIAQGAETWTNTVATTTINESHISIVSTAEGGVEKGVRFNYDSFDYNDGVATTTTTWSSLQTGGIQAGETIVGAMTSAVTGTVTYGTEFATKPKIVLTMNLNGTGTSIIPVAVSSHTGSGPYTGFTWIAGTTSATATISWYATL